MLRLVTPPEAIATHGYDPYAAAETGWFGSGLVRAIKKGVKTTVHAVKSVSRIPAVRAALSSAETALKDSGPWGMAANAAIQAMGAGLSGKNLEEIAWSAAEGAAPTGIDRALSVAHNLRRGGNVVSAALGAARGSFVAASPALAGFDLAARTLATSASKANLGAARRALGSEDARRAFDTAVGVVSRAAPAATRMPMSSSAANRRAASLAHTVAVRRGGRGLSVADPLSAMRASSAPRVPFAATNHVTALVHAAVANNPSLAAQSPGAVASALGLPTQSTALALRTAPRVLPFRALSSGASAFVRRFAPYAPGAALTGDTAGLVDNGAVYVVESGDYLTKIAQKLIGDANRYRELMTANPSYPRSADGSNFKNVWTGMRLKLPASWVKPALIPAITPAPTAAAAAPAAATVLQAKATLAAWGATDGAGRAGLADYGTQPSDLSTDWGARDKLMLASFSTWANSSRGTSLTTDGALTSSHADALRAWAEAKAAGVVPQLTPAPAPAPAPAPTPTLAPAASTLPSSGSFPDLTPAQLQLPPLSLPALPAPAATSTPAMLPAPADHPALPPLSVKAKTAAKKKDDGLIIPVGLALAFLV
jgi:hypothetical protein